MSGQMNLIDARQYVGEVSPAVLRWLDKGARKDSTVFSGLDAARKVAKWIPNLGPKFYRACADVYDEVNFERWNPNLTLMFY